MKLAAEGFARITVTEWRAAAAMGSYNKELSHDSANAQRCLSMRSDQAGKPVTPPELAVFVGTLAATPELVAAQSRAHLLSKGHPAMAPAPDAKVCSVIALE